MTQRMIIAFAALAAAALGSLGSADAKGPGSPGGGPTLPNSNEVNGLSANGLVPNALDTSGQPLRGFAIVGIDLPAN